MIEMRRVALELSINSEVSSLLNMREVENQQHFQFYMLHKRLKEYSITNSYIEDIAVGYLDTGTVITNKGVYDSIEQFCTYIGDSQLPDFFKSRASKASFLITGHDKRKENCLAYLLSLPLEPKSSNNAFIFIRQNGNIMAPLYQNLGNRLFQIQKADRTIILGASSFLDAHSERLITLRVPSEISPVEYLYIIDDREYMQAVNRINTVAIFSMILVLGVCIIILTISIRRNYYPVRRLMRNLGISKQQPSFVYHNEFELIEKNLLDIQQEKERLIEEADKNAPAIRELLLSQILLGDMSDVDAGATELDLSCGSAFAVVVILPYQYLYLFKQNGEEQENYFMLQYIVRNMFQDFQENKVNVYHTTIDHHFCELLSGDPDNLKNRVERLNELSKLLHQSFGVEVYIGVSLTLNGVRNLSKCFQKAMEAVECAKLRRMPVVIYGKQYSPSSTGHFWDSETARKLKNTISIGDFESALCLLSHLYQMSFYMNQPVNEAKQYMGLTFQILCASFENLKANNPHVSAPYNRIIEQFSYCDNFDQFYICALHALIDAEYIWEQNSLTNEDALKQSILSYIEGEYQHYELNVNSTAEHFGMTSSAMSMAFKKMTGIGLLNYINQVRIAHAKEMLKQGASVSQVAKAVGYNDASAFIRNFKKHEGISPGKY